MIYNIVKGGKFVSKKNNDTKTRILAVERLFQRKKRLTVPQIKRILEIEYDLETDRKTLYDDIATLTRFMNIEVEKIGWDTYYILKEM